MCNKKMLNIIICNFCLLTDYFLKRFLSLKIILFKFQFISFHCFLFFLYIFFFLGGEMNTLLNRTEAYG